MNVEAMALEGSSKILSEILIETEYFVKNEERAVKIA